MCLGNGELPCTNCIDRNEECVLGVRNRRRPKPSRPKDTSDSSIQDRLARVEELLATSTSMTTNPTPPGHIPTPSSSGRKDTNAEICAPRFQFRNTGDVLGSYDDGRSDAGYLPIDSGAPHHAQYQGKSPPTTVEIIGDMGAMPLTHDAATYSTFEGDTIPRTLSVQNTHGGLAPCSVSSDADRSSWPSVSEQSGFEEEEEDGCGVNSLKAVSRC